VFHQTVIKLY